MLVVSASMGAGHDGAAQELSRRLEASGARIRTVDFLEAAPRTGKLLRGAYELQLSAAPWSYEGLYRVWFLVPLLCKPVVALLGFIFGRRILRWSKEWRPDVIISTYPLASVVLGRYRCKGRIAVPVATFLTDFAVHPLWLHAGVDMHLCVHPQTADAVRRCCPASSVAAPGPLVSGPFRSATLDRREARRLLGLPEEAAVVLIVAGSWGVGDLEATFEEVSATGRYVPVAVCGHNERLRRRLEGRGGVVLGWTDKMPQLMAASDVLLQNGGGLTCMEAFAAGLPVVSFRPIPGHGRQNAADMARAGVAAFAKVPSELMTTLEAAATLPGRAMANRARQMFSDDAAVRVVELAGRRSPTTPAGRRHSLRRAAMALTLSGVGAIGAVNLAADAATAAGIGVAHPSGPDTYLAVRLGPSDITDPAIGPMLARSHAAAIVEGSLALRYPSALRRLHDSGVRLANGGWGPDSSFHLLAVDDGVARASQQIERAAGISRCADFAPDTAVTGADLASAHVEHERVVRPSVVATTADAGRGLRRGLVYVVNAERSGPSRLEVALLRLDLSASARRVHTVPLTSLG